MSPSRASQWIEADGLKGTLREFEPMSRHTSWRTGGRARWFYTPSDKADLSQFLQKIPAGTDIVLSGLGSNMLVRDGGFDGVVISTLKGLNRLHHLAPNSMYAEAGVPSPKLAKNSTRNSLCGGEFLVGIPGTIGGALAMNAGCFGSETWQFVQFAEVIKRNGQLERRNPEQVSWGYRYAQVGEGEWFAGAQFGFTPCRSKSGREKIKHYLQRRASTQPVQTANAGSVFRNPEGDFAARLIDSAGLKNYAVGGARISPTHANFIENQSEAKAGDIENLIHYAHRKVQQIFGVSLELEVKIIGERESKW